MDWGGADTLTGVIAIFTAVGGFLTGRRAGTRDEMSIASDAVNMLQAQVDGLKSEREARDREILDLRSRVGVLEGLVTQRAEVAAVHTDVVEIRVLLDRIADKVGA